MTLSTTLLLATLLPLAVALGHALGRRRAASAERAAAEPLAEGRLLASLSHEIRTPLNGIAGMTNFLVHSDLDSTQHECVHTIQSCVDSLLFLVNDVLDYSKLESGRMEFEHIEFDLGTQLEDAVEVFALEARAAGVVLLPDVPADRSWKYSGDPYRLRQIVLNFVSNAIKFNRRGGHVLVRLSAVDETESALVRIAVEDTGPGVTPEQRERLFRPFSQLDASTTRRHGGTGLGLAITRGLAESMGGTVGVATAESGGAEFWVEVPLERAPRDGRPEGPGALAGTTVLVADPLRVARELIARRLRELGADVEERAEPVLDGAAPEVALVSARCAAEDIERLRSTGTRVLVHGERGADAGVGGIALREPLRRARLVEALRAPREAQEPPAIRPAAESADEPGLDETGFRRLTRILVVDDNAVNLRVVETQLKRLGYRAECVESGEAAVEAIDGAPFDLILMDRQMPGLDGLEATRLIRARERERGERRTPVVALTADALDSARRECLAAGMDDFLVKPVSGEDLAAIVTRWVNYASA